MSKVQLPLLGLAAWLAMATAAQAQVRPYIGFVYPAGGQQGTTFEVRLGGQGMDGGNEVLVSGEGVRAKVVEYYRRLGPQEVTLLREQEREFTRGKPLKQVLDQFDGPTRKLIDRIEMKISQYVARPACASLSSAIIAEVTIAPGAEPGEREIVVATPRGVSNPLPFLVGQVPEHTRKPMKTAEFQVLGKEELALRNRPEEEVEARVFVPCTLNGQIASGEVNRYRFEARQGQRLVISAQARRLVPFIADAVPGWFQPVMSLCDAGGREVAYSDDYRFQPDPVIYYEVPKDGEYVLNITDAIYRGREDFVYRVTLGELPFVTSIFPLGRRVGAPVAIQMSGWNLESAEVVPPPPDAGPGVYSVAARTQGTLSNRVPFALDTLPEALEKEPNNDVAHAQKVKLPIIVNGRINRPDDWDVFQLSARAGDTIVAEVTARRLDSPLDSFVKVTDAQGKLLAFNDDCEDPGAGVNTHHADSYVMVKLPADGTYYVHLGDTARASGEAYSYRLRLSPPRPDFELFAVPSSAALRSKSTGAVTIHAFRKDGFAGPIKLGLKDPPPGFSAGAGSVGPTQAVTRLAVKTDLRNTQQPVALAVEGRAKVGEREIVREAVPADDRMQAFLWRHLLPAEDLSVLVFDPSYEPPPKRVAPVPPPPPERKPEAAPSGSSTTAGKPKFTKQQVAGRLRQLKILFEDGLLTEDFYSKKVAECEAVQ